MKLFIAVIAGLLASASAVPDKLPANRGGRQLDTGYVASEAAAAPIGSYGVSEADSLANYDELEEDQATYGGDELDAQASADSLSSASDEAGDPLDMLMKAVPGIPGEDYPIFAEAPETAFSCEGQVNGGYYADEEAECQVFHICTGDAEGGLAKYSFLCPNGTIFNQEYFICDWWFNVDCSESAALAEAKNAELQGAREEASLSAASDADDDLDTQASEPVGGYLASEAAAAPVSSYGVSEEEQPQYSSFRF